MATLQALSSFHPADYDASFCVSFHVSTCCFIAERGSSSWGLHLPSIPELIIPASVPRTTAGIFRGPSHVSKSTSHSHDPLDTFIAVLTIASSSLQRCFSIFPACLLKGSAPTWHHSWNHYALRVIHQALQLGLLNPPDPVTLLRGANGFIC